MRKLFPFVAACGRTVVHLPAALQPHWKCIALAALLLTLFWPLEPAEAQNLRPIRTVAQNIATALTGPFAVAVATIGLVGCGFLAMSGRMPWSAAIAVIAGIVLIFGAARLVTEIQAVAAN